MLSWISIKIGQIANMIRDIQVAISGDQDKKSESQAIFFSCKMRSATKHLQCAKSQNVGRDCMQDLRYSNLFGPDHLHFLLDRLALHWSHISPDFGFSLLDS